MTLILIGLILRELQRHKPTSSVTGVSSRRKSVPNVDRDESYRKGDLIFL